MLDSHWLFSRGESSFKHKNTGIRFALLNDRTNLGVPVFTPAIARDTIPTAFRACISTSTASLATFHHLLITQHPIRIIMSTSDTSAALLLLPHELHVNILTYLRAYDLSGVQQTCRFFASRDLIRDIVQHTAEEVFPADLTEGFITKDTKEYTFKVLRNMELLVVSRVLNRPEPTSGYFVSKSWCRTALKWLEVQAESTETPKKQKKLTKRQVRMRDRRLSDVSPPWPNVNSDLLCTHSNLQHCSSSKSARSRRRVMDKQAWKVLKRLYPDSTSLEVKSGECLQCAVEEESSKKAQESKKLIETEKRKLPLSCPLVRRIYTRSRGVPSHSLVGGDVTCGHCPLQPGIYYILPRSWLHGWRKYLKTGEGDRPSAPDASILLCEAHRFPLLPPHLEQYVHGKTTNLLSACAAAPSNPLPASRPVGLSPTVDSETMNALRAAGLSQAEVNQQIVAMMAMQVNQRVTQPRIPDRTDNESLDRENKTVVEILTDDEYTALEKFWPSNSNFSLRFAVVPEASGESTISWSTLSCRECDASGRADDRNIHSKNRARSWVQL